jgi:hypothetical protein
MDPMGGVEVVLYRFLQAADILPDAHRRRPSTRKVEKSVENGYKLGVILLRPWRSDDQLVGTKGEAKRGRADFHRLHRKLCQFPHFRSGQSLRQNDLLQSRFKHLLDGLSLYGWETKLLRLTSRLLIWAFVDGVRCAKGVKGLRLFVCAGCRKGRN